jgi:hypothetical protein
MVLMVATAVSAGASKTPQTPTTGQPGVSAGHSCGPSFPTTPGNSATAAGSAFNPNVTKFYAGNPGSASVIHSNSSAAVSQYDIACR